MKAAIIIPARYASSRFPGKPLVSIAGKSLIRHVWERCTEAFPSNDIFVATDDERISKHCQENQMNFVMTSKNCLTGTDRVYEASQQLNYDLFINVQGDEPLISGDDIKTVFNFSVANPSFVTCGMGKIHDEADFRSPGVPKVVSRPDGKLMYMSRAAIPTNKALAFTQAFRQVCIYGFPKAALKSFYQHGKKTALEEIEDIEILRFLELGFEVKMTEVGSASVAVDFPEDVARVEKILAERKSK